HSHSSGGFWLNHINKKTTSIRETLTKETKMSKSQTQKWQADMSRGIVTKPKIMTTCRIRISAGKVIYVSSQLATQMKQEGLTQRMEMNVFVPLKGFQQSLLYRLREIAKK